MEIDANEPELCERLLCPEDECTLHYSNVGNVNRHRVNNHGRTYPEIAEESKSGRMRCKKIMALVIPRRRSKACETTTSEGGREMNGGEMDDTLSESGSPDDAAQPSRRTRHLEQPIIPPLPPLAGLVGHQENPFDAHAPDPYTDFNIVNDAFGTTDATFPPVDGSIASHPPPFPGTMSISTPSSYWATPPPPYPAHPAGFPDDYDWARQDFSPPMNSAPVDEKLPSFDATPRAHSPRPLAYQPAAMVSHITVPVANSSSAPTMGFPSAPTTAFPLVLPPQSEVFWREQIEATVLRQRQAEAFRQQQELALQREITSAQHRMVQPPRHEQDAGMFRTQQQQVEDPWAAAMIQELQAHLATSATTHFPANFDHLARQAGTSNLQVPSYATYPPPPSSDFSLHPRDRVVYEQRAPLVTETPFFPAFDSCHFPALEPRKQITQTPFSDVHQELTGAASSALNLGDAFIPWSSFEWGYPRQFKYCMNHFVPFFQSIEGDV
ncbi:hypothetical protein EV122DRAFT_293822 [Schizophyllum commune]